MKPISIGVVTTGLSSTGGMDRFSKGVVEVWCKRPDVSRVVVLTKNDRKNDPSSATVHAVITASQTSFSLGTQVRVFISCMRYLRGLDLIYCAIESYGPGTAFASLVLRKPFFITLAGTYSMPPKGPGMRKMFKRALMRFMYRRARMILTMSERNIRLINEIMPVKNWKFMPNGVDLEEFPMGTFMPGDPYILTVGALKRRKGQDVTIRALAILKDKFPKLRYIIVGSVQDSPGFAEDLSGIANKAGLSERVEFAGRIPDAELKKLYQGCTAFVLAARTVEGSFEGFPMVFYEAQACGAPIISTYGFGSEFAIKNGYNGYLVQPGDERELADAIAKIAGSDQARIEMGKHGRLEAKLHTWDDVGADYMQEFRQFLR